MLWFENLTVPGAGLAGMVLPLTIASTYFANTHVLEFHISVFLQISFLALNLGFSSLTLAYV